MHVLTAANAERAQDVAIRKLNSLWEGGLTLINATRSQDG